MSASSPTGPTGPAAPDVRPRPPVWFIFSVTVAGILANSLLSPLTPTILDHFGRSEAASGPLVASAALPGVFLAPVIGIMADRFGRRNVLLPCLVIFGLGASGVAAAWSFEAILAFRVLQGAGSAGLLGLSVVLIADHWNGAERTRLIGRNAAVLTMCLAIVPGVSGVVADLTDWRVSMAFGAFALPVAVIGWKVLPRVDTVATRTVGDQISGAVQLARNPRVLAVMASGFVFFTALFGVFLTVLPLHLEGEFGLGELGRGLVLSAPAVGSFTAAYNLGRTRERLSLRMVLILGGVLIAVAALVMGVAPSVWLIVIAAIAYGLGDGSSIPSLQDLVTELSGETERASVMALWTSAVRLGQTVGPLLFGALLDVRSTGAVMVLGAGVFALLAVIFVLGPFDEPDDAAIGAA